MTRLLLLILALLAISILGTVTIRTLRHRRDAGTYDHELEQEWDDETTLLDLPPADLVGTDSDNSAGADAGLMAAEVAVPGSDEDEAGAQVVLGVDARGSVAVDVAVAVRLTPKQRRRALHKGRIPRDLPGPAVHALSGEQVRPAGELHHPRHERIPQPMGVWDGDRWFPVFPTLLESARHEAHFRQWEAEMASLIDGAYAWLETAA